MFKLIKIQLEIFEPCKRCFLLWKLTFSVASSPYLSSKTHQNWAWNFWTLQTLFPSLKIDIFCCIVPLFFIKNMKWKLLENFLRPCKRWFSLWKSPFSDASPPYYLPMFPTNYAQTSPNRISPSRNSLCRENRIRGARAARMAGCAE